jgi:hypothetical protein
MNTGVLISLISKVYVDEDVDLLEICREREHEEAILLYD